jgi:poly(A) polymerase
MTGTQDLSAHPPQTAPIVIPRAQHRISRKDIDEDALKVLYRLHHHGFLAFLVGGSVRDLLLGKVPKDFDIATNAHPHEVTGLFRNSRIIGRRFRLVHVFFRGGKNVEVSTFRSRSEYEEEETEDGEIIRTDSFGTPGEDALRRDITINGLFYNIANFSLIDYVGGIRDLEKQVIRTIGDPDERYRHDPVRMIRVIRHASRTGFSIERRTYEAILRQREEIKTCSPSRVRDEFLRDLREGSARPSLDLMLRTGLLNSMFPDFHRVFGDRNPLKTKDARLCLSLFGLVDQLVALGRKIPESIFVALLTVPLLRSVTPEHAYLGEKERNAYLAQSIRLIAHQLLAPYSFPKGPREMAIQILIAQSYLRKSISRGMIPGRLRTKKYFQDAVLLYGIESEATGERVPAILRRTVPPDLLPWWPKEVAGPGKRRRRVRRRSRPHEPSAQPPGLLHEQIGEPESKLWKQKEQGRADTETD